MGRSRSRSRERRRSRSRSRSRDRRDRSRSNEREGGRRRRRFEEPDPSSAMAQMQALAAAQAQAQLQRQLALQANPQLNMPAQLGLTTAAAKASTSQEETQKRKARELYIGNLAVGVTTSDQLREVFNGALAGMVGNPEKEPAVNEVKMDPMGRFAFVELRTEELAAIALNLTGTEINGRGMKIGRPNGYVPSSEANMGQAKLAAAAALAAKLGGGTTNVVLLENLLPAVTMREDDERREVLEMVFEEAAKCGKVVGVACPVPPPSIDEKEPNRVYVKYNSTDCAQKLKDMMDGRLFDDNTVKAIYSTDHDFGRARLNEWIIEGEEPPGPPPFGSHGPPGGGFAYPPPPSGGGLTGAPIVMHF